MSTDFFDDDLVSKGAAGSGFDMDDDGVQVVPISEMSLNKLAQQKDEVNTQVASAVQKIEHLRNRQSLLEREKRELEELASTQETYESGKKEMLDKLSRWLIILQKEHVQAERMVELLSETRARFNESLRDLESIDESNWSDEDFQLELNRALVKVDIAKSTYTKAIAKIEATSWHKEASGNGQFDVVKEARREVAGESSFFYWLKVGVAVTLPLIVTLVAIFLVLRYLPQGVGI